MIEEVLISDLVLGYASLCIVLLIAIIANDQAIKDTMKATATVFSIVLFIVICITQSSYIDTIKECQSLGGCNITNYEKAIKKKTAIYEFAKSLEKETK